MDLLLVTVTGVAYGVAVLVLVALGLAVIFGMMGVLNLAQGEFLMLGAYTVLVVARFGGSIWLGILLAPSSLGSLGSWSSARSSSSSTVAHSTPCSRPGV